MINYAFNLNKCIQYRGLLNILIRMKNPFSYSSLSSYCSDNTSNDNQSFKYSRASTELERSRLAYTTYNPLSSTSKLSSKGQSSKYFPYQPGLSFAKKDRKQNPFLYAKPFKFTKKQHLINKQVKGLAKWQKKKYLQQYIGQNITQSKTQQLKTKNEFEKINTPRDQELKSANNIQNWSKYPQYEVEKDTKRLRKSLSFQAQPIPQRNNDSKGFKDQYSFSHNIQLNPFQQNIPLKQKILQPQQYRNVQSPNRHKRARQSLEEHNKGSQEEDSKSIIHKLQHQNQVKLQPSMAYSKVQEHKFKSQTIQKNDSTLKRETYKITQVDSNFDLDPSNPKFDINPIGQQYPKEIRLKHQTYELINIL